MKISSKEFGLGDSINLTINSNDNDGLIFIPNEIKLECNITNSYGKIVINSIYIETTEDVISLNEKSIGDKLDKIDIKNIDRFIFKQLNDPSSINHNPFTFFLNYDLSSFEKGRRLSETDWAIFASLYCFACHAIPKSINVFLPLGKFLRVSEENIKKLIKKLPEKIYRKSGALDQRGGDLSLYGEDLIKQYFKSDTEALESFEVNPYLKFYYELD